jgi:hypothetical protein
LPPAGAEGAGQEGTADGEQRGCGDDGGAGVGRYPSGLATPQSCDVAIMLTAAQVRAMRRAWGCLIPNNAQPQALATKQVQRRYDIRVQVKLTEPLRFALLGALLPGLIQVKTRPEDLKRLPVILATRDDRIKDR